jgi:hypothetical protein
MLRINIAPPFIRFMRYFNTLNELLMTKLMKGNYKEKDLVKLSFGQFWQVA